MSKIEWKERTWNPSPDNPDILWHPLKWRKPSMVFVNSMSDLFHEAVPFEFVDQVFAVTALCPRHTFQVLTKRPERMAEYFRSIELDRTRHDRMNDFANSISEPPDNDICINREWPHRNVWLGTSVEDQARADERIPHLLRCPAAVRFVSFEPLLGEVDLTEYLTEPASIGLRILSPFYNTPDGKFDPDGGGTKIVRVVRHPLPIHWLIVGGESGRGARPCDIEWIRSIVKQGANAGVPVFVKQLGARPYMRDADFYTLSEEYRNSLLLAGTFEGLEDDEIGLGLRDPKGGDMSEWPEDLRVRQWPRCVEKLIGNKEDGK